jgi:hypothetical protein
MFGNTLISQHLQESVGSMDSLRDYYQGSARNKFARVEKANKAQGREENEVLIIINQLPTQEHKKAMGV